MGLVRMRFSPPTTLVVQAVTTAACCTSRERPCARGCPIGELIGTAAHGRVEHPDTAEARRFLGSHTDRIDGEDVEPGADDRTDFGPKCRLFATSEGLRGLPADEWLLRAVERAHGPSRLLTAVSPRPARQA